jgi:hypothetical protein
MSGFYVEKGRLLVISGRLGIAELRSKEQENANERQCTQIRSKPVLLPIINCRSEL